MNRKDGREREKGLFTQFEEAGETNERTQKLGEGHKKGASGGSLSSSSEERPY